LRHFPGLLNQSVMVGESGKFGKLFVDKL